jgi:hypothetical protein
MLWPESWFFFTWLFDLNIFTDTLQVPSFVGLLASCLPVSQFLRWFACDYRLEACSAWLVRGMYGSESFLPSLLAFMRFINCVSSFVWSKAENVASRTIRLKMRGIFFEPVQLGSGSISAISKRIVKYLRFSVRKFNTCIVPFPNILC